jgi:TonB family protein
MNAALIYRPNNRKLIWIAFACAVTAHLAAVGLANNKPQSLSPVVSPGSEVEITDFPPANSEEPEVVLPPEQPSNEQQEFVDESLKPAPVHPRKKISPVQAPGVGLSRASNAGSAKALALYAPRPNYPYEARRGRITGSGIAHLTVNPVSGSVIDVRMSQSTGNAILDNATVSAFRRWRFRPGVASNVDVPITYTLIGVSY